MEKSNILVVFLFSIIDNIIFIGILSKFRNDDDYKIIDITVITVLSVIITFFTQFGIAPYVKLIFLFILLFGVTFLYEINFYKKILAIVFYYFILVVSELLVTLLASNILDLNIVTIQAKYTYFFLGLFSKFFSILLFIFINRRFLKNKIVLPKLLNYMFILILVLSTVSMILLFYSSLSLSSEGTIFMLFLVSLFALFSILIVSVIYYNANIFYVNLQRETAKEIYNKSYEKFIVNSEIRNDALSKIWHDIGSHMEILEKINTLENSTHIEYINSIKDRLKSIPNTINTGNKLIDIILNDKYAEAKVKGINFDIKSIAPPKLNIDDIDLSSMLFNTIDNAIEACLNCNGKDRYIFLELYPDGNFLSYKIRNSFTNLKNNDSKKMYYNKKKYISSGYGNIIIRDIVDKYDGYLDINNEMDEYSLDIVLHLNRDYIPKS